MPETPAIKLFQSGNEDDIRLLESELGSLLRDLHRGWNPTATKLKLQEFEDNFEWDESYSVEASWEMECLEDHIEYLDCSSKEEALAFVNGDEEIKEPDLSDYFPTNFAPSHNPSCTLWVSVKNLRLKPQQPRQKKWKLFLEILADSDLDDTDLDLFLGDVVRFSRQRGGEIKVVGNDLAEADSFTPSWAGVIAEQ